MTYKKKEIIARTLLNIAAEQGKITIEEISKRSHISRNTIKNNFENGIIDIVKYMYIQIINEVNTTLLKYDVNKLSLEDFADIVLPVFWNNREKARIIYISNLPFRLLDDICQLTWNWCEDKFNKLVIVHGLEQEMSGFDLLIYFNAQLISIFTFWLSVPLPIDVENFKPKFLFLMNISIIDLVKPKV